MACQAMQTVVAQGLAANRPHSGLPTCLMIWWGDSGGFDQM